MFINVCWTASSLFVYLFFIRFCFLSFSLVLFVTPCFLLAKMVPDRILSVNASIDTIGEILLKIIPTLEEVSCHNNCAYKQRAERLMVSVYEICLYVAKKKNHN